MGSDSRIISYSTIHLSRREEILIQSIISLYNSKDNYKWIYHETGDDVSVVVVGSEAKSLIETGSDPFSVIGDKHVIIMLGGLFYPKNARALVRVALPIKALDLVDKLGHIERDIISKPISISYIADSIAAAMVDAPNKIAPKEAVPINKDAPIEFVVKAPAFELVTPHGESDKKVVTDTETTSQKMVLSNTSDNKIQPSFDLKERTPASIYVNTPNDDTACVKNEKTESSRLKGFPSFKFNFSGTRLDKEREATANVATKFNQDEKIEPTGSKETFDYTPPKIASSTPAPLKETVSEMKPASASLQETVEYIAPTDTITTTAKEIDAPTLTDVAPRHISRSGNVVPLHSAMATPVATSTNTAAQLNPSLVKDTELVPATATTEPSQELAALVASSRRIKLLRWPKSEVIQRHPGNAILASMVINMPMSAEEMAKQSDLPVPICQRFLEAVIGANVAVYVDVKEPTTEVQVQNTAEAQVENTAETSHVEDKQPENGQPESEPVVVREEKKTKRKGILYRIRAALGLLRK